jgi:hypothetical protein
MLQRDKGVPPPTGLMSLLHNFPRASAPGLVSFAPPGLMHAKATAAECIETFVEKIHFNLDRLLSI